MPYRRLPKTDSARIVSMRLAVETEQLPYGKQPVPFNLLQKAKTLLPQFEDQVRNYQYVYGKQVERSRSNKEVTRKARMYVSHFIQVFNMAIERGEIKASKRALYGLEPWGKNTPKLLSDDELYEIGKKVIAGEMQRIAEGGIPINYPSIQWVKIHYDQFCDCRYSKQTSQQTTFRGQKSVADMREKIDNLIFEMWNAIEKFYENLEPEAKLDKCRECGVIYYYRSGEKAAEEQLVEMAKEEFVIADSEEVVAVAEEPVAEVEMVEPEPATDSFADDDLSGKKVVELSLFDF